MKFGEEEQTDWGKKKSKGKNGKIEDMKEDRVDNGNKLRRKEMEEREYKVREN
jgi:hypothetical protein